MEWPSSFVSRRPFTAKRSASLLTFRAACLVPPLRHALTGRRFRCARGSAARGAAHVDSFLVGHLSAIWRWGFLFAAWLGEAERRAKPATWIPLILLPLLLPLVGARCNSASRQNLRRRDHSRTRRRRRKGHPAVRCGSNAIDSRYLRAESLVGPSLERIASRVYIAAIWPNEPNAMIGWISRPSAPCDLPPRCRLGRDRAGGARHRRLPVHVEVMPSPPRHYARVRACIFRIGMAKPAD